MKFDLDAIKQYKLQIACILGGFILFAVISLINPNEDKKDYSYVERSGYGGAVTEQRLVSGLSDSGEETLMDINVLGRKFSDEEIDAKFDEAAEKLPEMILGKNTGLDTVAYDLNLISNMSDYGFSLVWVPENQRILSSSGEVKNYDLEEALSMRLKVIMSDGEREAEYAYPITVIPQILTEEEGRIKRFKKLLASEDEEKITAEGMYLPNEFEGRKITYAGTEKTDYNFIWIIGILMAVLLYVKDKQKFKDDSDKRLHQMQLDYPDIVSKLQVFIGAGMSIRSAWDCICHDYETSGQKDRYGYEEMCKANAKLKTGISESKVYRDFGRESKCKQYMKLASLLDQNRKSGVANLKNILALEVVEAWEERKNMALRLGEEASTKLLFPLLMMLGVVMIVIMVPAMSNF